MGREILMQSSTDNGLHHRMDGFVSYEDFIDACSILVSAHQGAPRGDRLSFNILGEVRAITIHRFTPRVLRTCMIISRRILAT